MTGLDPLAPWTLVHEHPYEHGYMRGGNDRLDALRPLIAAANELAENVLSPSDSMTRMRLARELLDLTTPKGDTP